MNPISPPYYQRYKQETIDMIMDIAKDLPGDEAVLVGNAIKYLSRYRIKHPTPLEDAKKAQWYVNKLVELLESTPSSAPPTQKKLKDDLPYPRDV